MGVPLSTSFNCKVAEANGLSSDRLLFCDILSSLTSRLLFAKAEVFRQRAPPIISSDIMSFLI